MSKKNGAEDTRKEFVNRIEAFGDNVKKKNDELLVKLREKYVGVRMHDVDPGESDDSQDSGYDEIRQVTNVEYQKRVKGQQQGYYVHTALVKEDGKGLDTSAESGERYFITKACTSCCTRKTTRNIGLSVGWRALRVMTQPLMPTASAMINPAQPGIVGFGVLKSNSNK
tara:strand:+ start:150 stop:656 length:507 start_codon:yes stop_codon:yes gene_type:complete